MSLVLTSSPDDLRKDFFALQNRGDVANLLEVDEKHLIYHLYIAPVSIKYTTFHIPKRSGGLRKITAPVSALKIIQRKLNQVLQHVYQPKPSVHGFIYGRSIVTNAEKHIRRRYVLNVDLKDFFPSINFGRVRGMFMAPPYNLNAEVATILAQICCFDNQLPQGAPTSPIVSNMICARMDTQLQNLAKTHKCTYTRYADDLTFSTSLPNFPPALARVISAITEEIEIGHELNQVILQNGFEVNKDKVRLQLKNRRQEVTGLTTNKFPNVQRKYIRQIRAMLHAWSKYGLKAAEEEFWNRYDKKRHALHKQKPSFARVVKGKIEFLGMVKGQDDPVYRRLYNKMSVLAPELLDQQKRDDLQKGRFMIRNLKIERFRTHKFAELQDVGRINLLVGKNNAGKTVALEALFLLSFPVYPSEALAQLIGFRGYDIETDSEEMWDSLFYNWNQSKEINLEIEEDIISNSHVASLELASPALESRTRSLTIKRTSREGLQKKNQRLRLDFVSSAGDSIQHTLTDLTDSEYTQRGTWELLVQSPAFIPAYRTISQEWEAQQFSLLQRDGRHHEVIEILTIIEPRLQDLSVIALQGKGIVYGRLEHQSRLMPLALMGNGMLSVFSIALRMLNYPGGLVLIDEIENGLHYSVLVDLWRVVIETARRFDVQVFATTHSDECIRALTEALNASGHTDDMRVYRFDRRDETTHVVDYTAEVLEAAIEVGLEVRG